MWQFEADEFSCISHGSFTFGMIFTMDFRPFSLAAQIGGISVGQMIHFKSSFTMLLFRNLISSILFQNVLSDPHIPKIWKCIWIHVCTYKSVAVLHTWALERPRNISIHEICYEQPPFWMNSKSSVWYFGFSSDLELEGFSNKWKDKLLKMSWRWKLFFMGISEKSTCKTSRFMFTSFGNFLFMTFFSVKSTYLLKSWFHGNFWA